MSSLLKCRCLSRAAQGFIERTALTVRNGVRLLSLNSAISNGIRRGRYVDSSPEDRTWSRSKPVPQQGERRRKPQRRESRGNSTRGRGSYDLRLQASQKRSPKKGPNGTDEDVLNKQVSLFTKVSRVPPPAIPYMSAVSEFIYGFHPVRSAIRAGRRKIYALYLCERPTNQLSGSGLNSLQKLAVTAGAKVKIVSSEWSQALSRVCKEVASLPVTNFNVKVAPQSKEEAAVNGTSGLIPLTSLRQDSYDDHRTQHNPRYPFTLLLDGIVDPHNLGAILRSAYYFGADAVAFSSRNSAPLSPVVMKSSSGAAEHIPLISIHDTVSFIDASRRNGWRFFAAEPPASVAPDSKNKNIVSSKNLPNELQNYPCVLMLGNEGDGLSKELKSKADASVVVDCPRKHIVDEVDSLNVAVASGILCEAFMRGSGVRSRANATSSFLPIPGPVRQDSCIQEEANDVKFTPREKKDADKERIF
ncbi:SpoU rRNA methylase [Coccidioides posadasii str. Silveira]|uniref:rRNA methyltransferase 1, mitochondrial n=2 Tax=Coccidioides posadasii TaxID=199306 RepID=E9DJ14_COCPS|nr:SpoU rRNA methylase [Coccidioides posadasii str. Silveira]KMM65996.1 23S rRNA (guanosine-2'-O-)-methyltransferase rlmB [Coccidioides posadasii RMSCC 3488]